MNRPRRRRRKNPSGAVVAVVAVVAGLGLGAAALVGAAVWQAWPFGPGDPFGKPAKGIGAVDFES